MWEKFGEFDSAEELNRAALAQRNEGDTEAVRTLAEENGLDPEDAEDFLDGAVDFLVLPFNAAVGKLTVESKELKLEGVLEDWVNDLIDMCSENKELSLAVRRKGKDLAGYIALIIDYGFEKRITVNGRITDRTQQAKQIMGSHALTIGAEDARTRRRLALEYYCGKKEA